MLPMNDDVVAGQNSPQSRGHNGSIAVGPKLSFPSIINNKPRELREPEIQRNT